MGVKGSDVWLVCVFSFKYSSCMSGVHRFRVGLDIGDCTLRLMCVECGVVCVGGVGNILVHDGMGSAQRSMTLNKACLCFGGGGVWLRQKTTPVWFLG